MNEVVPASRFRPPATTRPRTGLRFEEAGWSDTLLRHWRDLEQRAADAAFFQSAQWCRAWVDAAMACGEPAAPRIATLWRGERLVLLWPLAVRRLSALRILHHLAEPATQYGGVLIDAAEDRRALLETAWRAIRAWPGIDAIELRRIPEASIVAGLLGPHLRETTRASAPLLDFRSLGGAGADGQRTSRTRQTLRRLQRQLSEHGEVVFEIVTDRDGQSRMIEHAFALKRAWQTQKSAVSAGYAHGASEGCLLDMARAGGLLVTCLRCGSEVAAVEIGALRRRRYWSLVQSYDLRFAKHAPGRLLFWHLLARCPELSIDVFDFLAPAHPHKLEWANGAEAIGDYLVPVSGAGHLAVFYLARIKPMLRACHARLPPALRRRAGRLVRGLS